MPRGRGNIDHLAIAPAGVLVIDAKDHRGKVTVSSPLFGAAKLRVAGWDRTRLIDGLDRQVAAVEDALATSRDPDVGVQGVLCFTRADLPLLGTQEIRRHLLLYRKALAKRLSAAGPLQPSRMERLAQTLAAVFPPELPRPARAPKGPGRLPNRPLSSAAHTRKLRIARAG